MEIRNIATVAIVGGGIAGWMSAAFLAKMLGEKVSIVLVDTGEDTEAAFCEATLPPLKAFHGALGFNEAELISTCQVSMKLGTQFVNWGKLGNRYFHPHGSYGAEFDVVPLHQWWLKARESGDQAANLDDLSMAWGLAKEARFSLPVADRRLIQSTFDYAYHLDAALYRGHLVSFAKANRVVEKIGHLESIQRHGQTGFVSQILLRDGQSVKADLFLDCSGGEAILRTDVQSSSFIDWSGYLPCNQAVAVSCARGGEFTPYSRITARDAGWQWRIPLQHRTSMGYVFDRTLLSADDAINALMDNLDGAALAPPKLISLRNGRCESAFVQNVVAIGGAAGFLEPLDATGLHFVHTALTRLLALWPTTTCDPILTREYNDLTRAEWDLARDFLVLHYKATGRTDSALWRNSKDMAIPDSLQARLDHWQLSARLVSPRPEPFQAPSWLSVLIGQGINPNAWDPLADAREDIVEYQARLSGIAGVIQETAAQMPLHSEWLYKHARGARI